MFWNKNRSRNNIGVICPRCRKKVLLSSIPCRNCGGTLYRKLRTESWRTGFYGRGGLSERDSHTVAEFSCPSCLVDPSDLNCPNCQTSVIRLFRQV
jgi:hypothetical protein